MRSHDLVTFGLMLLGGLDVSIAKIQVPRDAFRDARLFSNVIPFGGGGKKKQGLVTNLSGAGGKKSVGTTALLVRTWTRRRYSHKSPSDLHYILVGAALLLSAGIGVAIASQLVGGARPRGIGQFQRTGPRVASSIAATRVGSLAVGSCGRAFGSYPCRGLAGPPSVSANRPQINRSQDSSDQ
jgi:hypothetical protein